MFSLFSHKLVKYYNTHIFHIPENKARRGRNIVRLIFVFYFCELNTFVESAFTPLLCALHAYNVAADNVLIYHLNVFCNDY